MIIQIIEQYPALVKSIHSVLTVFRVATETGYLFSARRLLVPDLDKIMHCEGLARGDPFYWCTWDITERDTNNECLDFHVTFGGYIGSDYKAYAQWWFTECVIAFIRAETKMGAFVTLDEQDSNSNVSSE